MSVKSIQSGDPDRLVYRQEPSYFWAVVVGFVGLAAVHGTVSVMIAEWPDDAWAYGGGIFLATLMIIWAIRKTARCEIVLDRTSKQAQVSTRWLWRTRKKVFETSAATEVLRCVSRPIETPDSHWVALRTSNGQELRLFAEPRCDELQSDEADRIAIEIGAHLNLPVVHVRNGVDAAMVDPSERTVDRG